MIISKYSGVSHSPRNVSSRSKADLCGLCWPTGAFRGTMTSDGWYMESGAVCARPEEIPIDVWMHRKNGELWMTTLNRLRFPLSPAPFFVTSASTLACSRMLAIWLPTCLACRKPP